MLRADHSPGRRSAAGVVKPIQHPTSNDVLAAPQGVPVDRNSALFVTRDVIPPHGEVTVSFWQPNEEELALMMRGMAVRLIVMGLTHPGVSLGVDGD
jgi:hypothetical protein